MQNKFLIKSKNTKKLATCIQTFCFESNRTSSPRQKVLLSPGVVINFPVLFLTFVGLEII